MTEPTNKAFVTSEEPAPEANSRHKPASLSDRVRSLRLPSESPAGSARSARLPWVLCLLLALSTLGLGVCLIFAAIRQEASRQDEPARTAADTRSAPVASSGEVALESKGYIIPVHQIQVSPKVSGLVLKLYIEEGKHVEKGDVLAELETDDYQYDVNSKKGELAEAETQCEQLRKDWKRNSGLQDSKAVSLSDFEQTESAFGPWNAASSGSEPS